MSSGLRLTQEEKRGLFGDEWTAHQDEWAAESAQRWGGTDAYRRSAVRTARYAKADWERVKAEMTEVQERFIALLRAGAPADGDEAVEVAEQSRQVNGRWFYDMSGEMQVGLGRMFVDDLRFAAQYEEQAEGLAVFVSTAYQANGARLQSAGG